MIKHSLLALSLAALAGPALAQSDDTNKWSGFYVGASVGNTDPRGGDDGGILFDTNLDGVIKYTGANNDRDIILSNVGSTTPNNSRTQQLP